MSGEQTYKEERQVNNLKSAAIVAPSRLGSMDIARLAFSMCVVIGLRVNATSLAAQTPRLQVAVAEGSNGDIAIASRLAARLRSLGDVDVVTVQEPYDYLLSVNVVCIGDSSCANESAFAGQAELREPLTRSWLGIAEVFAMNANHSRIVPRGTSRTPVNLFVSVGDSMWSVLRGDHFFKSDLAQTFYWPRAGIDRFIDELVADIDRKCFEHARLLSREEAAAERGDTTLRNQLDHQWMDTTTTKWAC